jgi:hypothetical protein
MLGFVTPPDVSKSFNVPPGSCAEGNSPERLVTVPELIGVAPQGA